MELVIQRYKQAASYVRGGVIVWYVYGLYHPTLLSLWGSGSENLVSTSDTTPLRLLHGRSYSLLRAVCAMSEDARYLRWKCGKMNGSSVDRFICSCYMRRQIGTDYRWLWRGRRQVRPREPAVNTGINMTTLLYASFCRGGSLINLQIKNFTRGLVGSWPPTYGRRPSNIYKIYSAQVRWLSCPWSQSIISHCDGIFFMFLMSFLLLCIKCKCKMESK